MKQALAIALLIGLLGCTSPSVSPIGTDPNLMPLTADQITTLMREGRPAPTSVAQPVVYATLKAYQGGYSGHWSATYFPGIFPPDPTLEATGMLATTVPGHPGTTFPEVIAGAVRPQVTAWAPDAQLVTRYNALPRSTPLPEPTDEVSVLTEFGWPLTYTSASRRENLAIVVDPSQTLLVRTFWAPARAVDTIPAERAIALLTAALQDPAFKSEEERTLTDYFLGTKLQAAPPGEPKRSDFVASSEPLYTLPPDAQWNTELRPMMGKKVWLVWNTNIPVDPSPADTTLDLGAAGTIDAVTGHVIRFRRVIRETRRIPNLGARTFQSA